MTKLSFPILLTIILSTLSGCDVSSTNEGVFPEYIDRSGRFTKAGPAGKEVYWDNKGNIIFVSEQLNDNGIIPKKEHYLYSWSPGESPRRLRSEQVNFSCFNGTEQLTQTKDGKFYVGSYEDPKESTSQTYNEDSKNRSTSFSPITCKHESILQRIGQEHHLELENFGKLIQKRLEKYPSFFNQDGRNLGVLDGVPIGSLKINFSPFLDSFVIMDFYTIKHAIIIWNKHGCLNGYILSKNGALSKFCVRKGPWSQGDSDFYLTKQGILVASHDNQPSLFWVNDNKHQVIIKGSIRDVEVDKSGCKVAVSHQFDLSRSGSKLAGEVTHFNICNMSME